MAESASSTSPAADAVHDEEGSPTASPFTPFIALDSEPVDEVVVQARGAVPAGLHFDVEWMKTNTWRVIQNLNVNLIGAVDILEEALTAMDDPVVEVSLRDRRIFRGEVNHVRAMLLSKLRQLHELATAHPATMHA